MPIYGYRCRNCGHELEVLQKMSDAPLKTCPKCSGELAKIVYAAGVVYKGSGYYSTDYKGASKAASNGAKSDSDGSGGSSDSKPQTESKAESRSESKTSESSSSGQR